MRRGGVGRGGPKTERKTLSSRRRCPAGCAACCYAAAQPQERGWVCAGGAGRVCASGLRGSGRLKLEVWELEPCRRELATPRLFPRRGGANTYTFTAYTACRDADVEHRPRCQLGPAPRRALLARAPKLAAGATKKPAKSTQMVRQRSSSSNHSPAVAFWGRGVRGGASTASPTSPDDSQFSSACQRHSAHLA